ncbi:hypothetical protein AAG565_13310 [Fontimonas sp. SYSU GA230001]|uniref:hypothetical protein n=1 Tax=Fontimonas sp. SYSU GA230001 TaxID=3142450 RepID=UPI0032B53952
MYKDWLAACVCAAFVVGCGGGSGGDDSNSPNPTPGPTATPLPTPPLSQFTCSPVGGGDATIQSICTTCADDAVTDNGKAIDTDLASAATVKLYNSPGFDPSNPTSGNVNNPDTRNVLLTATAQTGVVFPTGGKAGVIFGLPESFLVPFSGTLSTYQDDTPIDSLAFTSDEFLGKEGEKIYLGLDGTSDTFNAVQLTLTQAGGSLEEQLFRVYEFCSDGAARFR